MDRRLLLVPLLVCGLPLAAADTFNIRDFGAKGDGAAKDTAAIQKAIDAAARNGGTVLAPPGRYLSGTVRLKSRVTLHLDNGAVLLASPDNDDFDPFEKLPFRSVSDNETTYFRYGLVTAENASNIAITGQGVIDGNRTKRGGPKTIAMKLCQHVTIRGITVRNSPNYSISFWGSDYIDIDGVTILNGYADGIDPDASRFVRIANCYIDCWDDAICPKASPSMGMDNRRNTEHLAVVNCTLRTSCSNFKFGTESSGDLKDVTVSNVTMLARETGRRPISGISLESVDGANIDGVAISNVTMNGVRAPIFVRLGNRGRGLEPKIPGSVQNIIIRNVIARGAATTSSVTGLPGYPVRRVLLDGINISTEGGVRETQGFDVPEQADKYPEATMFGVLPALGFYLRHAASVSVSNLWLRRDRDDIRPAIMADDVTDLWVDRLRVETPPAPLIRLRNAPGHRLDGIAPGDVAIESAGIR